MARGKTNLNESDYAWACRSTYTKERVAELTASLSKLVRDSMDNDKKFLFKRWAFQNGVNPSRISYIAEIDPEFAEAFQVAKEWQEFKLEEDTLYKKTEYRMAIMMLCNHHGWKTHDDGALKQLGNEFGQYLAQQKAEYEERKKGIDDASSKSVN